MEVLGHAQHASTKVKCNNSLRIKLSKNPMLHSRNKHIDVWFHFLCELTKNGVVEMVHFSTQDQVTDALTKPLELDIFCKLREMMGVCLVSCVNRLLL